MTVKITSSFLSLWNVRATYNLVHLPRGSTVRDKKKNNIKTTNDTNHIVLPSALCSTIMISMSHPSDNSALNARDRDRIRRLVTGLLTLSVVDALIATHPINIALAGIDFVWASYLWGQWLKRSRSCSGFTTSLTPPPPPPPSDTPYFPPLPEYTIPLCCLHK